MENNKQLLSAMTLQVWAPSLIGAVFSTKRLQAQFFVKCCIQRPFIKNVTALIKIWHFLEGILSPLVKKKGEAEAGVL